MVSKQQRSPYYDNAKAVLIFLVVLGHFLGNPESGPLNNICKFIYLFHMPCFVFVSGFFAKRGAGIKQVLAQYISLLVVFQVLYHIFNIAMGSAQPLLTAILVPYSALWYLLSLACWVLALNVVPDKYIGALIPLAFIVAILIGALKFVGPNLSVSRTIYFSPFFLLGYYFKTNKLSEKVFFQSKIKLISLVLLTILTVGTLVVAYVLPFDITAYWGAISFKALKVSLLSGIFMRTGLLLTSCVLGFLFFCSIPNRSTIYTRFGSKTLPIYLMHFAFVQLFRHYVTPGATQHLQPLVLFAIELVLSLITYLITSLTIFNNAVLFIMEKSKRLLGVQDKPKAQEAIAGNIS